MSTSALHTRSRKTILLFAIMAWVILPIQANASLENNTNINTANLARSHVPAYLLSSIEKHVVDFVRQTISSLRYTAYQLGGARIDSSRGIYVVDCSTYVDHVLKTLFPKAFNSLTSWSGKPRPTTWDFYRYFTSLSSQTHHWNVIDSVKSLRPGDILVFRYKNKKGKAAGHIMILMDKPVQKGNVVKVRIADSAPARHSKDTRMPNVSGIGIGTMLLKVNPQTQQPIAYAWQIGSSWRHHVNFAMARPIKMA